MKKMNSLLPKGFQASKCKTQLRLGTSRIKVLHNKKGKQLATDKRDVAELLRNGQENKARLLVEQVIMEQDLIEAYDLLSLYAEQIAAQLPVIDSQRTCPSDLKEDISTLLYAASARSAELPDFAQILPMFVVKYGKEFVSAATALRPGCGVNGKVIEKLSANRAKGELKLKVMKEIAAEHNVDWDPAPFEREIRVEHDDVLPGPKADTSPISIDDFPSVPNQKPILGTHVLSQPENFTNSISGRFVNDKVEPTNSPRPDDFTTGSSPGAFTRTGPPSRKPPGRDPPPRPEDLTFDDRHPDVDPGSREKTQSRRNQRRESDSFLAPSPQARHQIEEARRYSLGVPREENVRGAQTGVDESLPKKHNRRDLQGAGIDDFDEASHRKGSHGRQYEPGFDGRQSQQFAGKEDSGKGRPQHQDQYAEEDGLSRVPNRGGSGKGRPQHQDHNAEGDILSRAPSREGSGKGRPQHQDHNAEEDILSRAPSREGSGKGRPQHQDHNAEEDILSRAPSREGSGKGRPQHQDHNAEEDILSRAPSREGSGKGRPQHQDHNAEEDILSRAPSREGSGKGRPQHQDQYAEEDGLSRVPNRGGSGKGRPQHQDHNAEGDILSRAPSREGSGKGRPQHQDHNAEEDILSRAPSREGSGKGRPQHQDQYAEEDGLSRVPNRGGSGKGRPQHQDHNAEEDILSRAPSREGSGKGRPQHQDQYAEGDILSRAPSREGFGGKPHFQETSVDEGSRGRISSRGKEDKVHPGKPDYRNNRKPDYSDEDADHVPEPRRRESTSNTPKYSDEDNYIPEWDNDHFRNSVTTRIPRNAEDEYHDSGVSSQRGSLNKRMSVEDTSRKSNNNPSVLKGSASSDATPHYDSSEEEYDAQHGGGTRKPEPRYNNNSFKITDSRNVDRSSESGEEGSRKGGTRRTSRLSSVDEQRRDTGDKRHGREDPAPVKTSSRQHPNFDHDDDQVGSDDDHFSSRTTNHDLSYTEKRMSMPGRSVHEKVKYQGNRPNDEFDDAVRRRATIGPEEIRRRENEDPPRNNSRYNGEKEKQLDNRRQSAPISKVMIQDDVMEGRHHSQRDKTDRGHRKQDNPVEYDGDRPRFSPQVGSPDDDEYPPTNTRTTQRDRSDRQRKPDVPIRLYDDGKPPRFMKEVNNQPNLEDEDYSRRASLGGFKGENPPQRFVNSPRGNNEQPTTPRSNLQSAKTDPELPRAVTEHHRKSQSAFAESSSAAPTTPRLQMPYTPKETISPKQQAGQPQSKPIFRKPPDLDSIIQMFGNMGNRKK